MSQSRLNSINTLTDEIHFDIANIGEEIIDHCPKAATKIINELIKKLEELKENLHKDEV